MTKYFMPYIYRVRTGIGVHRVMEDIAPRMEKNLENEMHTGLYVVV